MQALADGLVSGLAIALLAVGFAAAYLPARVFHLALGAVYVVVPYTTWQLLRYGVATPFAVTIGIAVGVSLSLACEKFNHGLLESRQALPEVHLISSLGIYIVVVQVLILLWGNDSKVLRQGTDASLSLGDVRLSRAQLIIVAVAIVVLAGFWAWLRLTRLGLQFRALADNPDELALLGYNVKRLRLLAFAISGLLSSAAALVVAFDVGFGPRLGLIALLQAVVATVIGGRGSLLAPILGGLVLGVLRTEVVWLTSARWQDGVVFAVLGGFLAFRPNGLLGRKVRLESQP
jgi:branched-chain amino acid transport system permease protein